MKKKLGLLVGAVAALTMTLPAATQSNLTICFGFLDLETEFWVAGHRAITTTLREQGVTVLEYNANEVPP